MLTGQTYYQATARTRVDATPLDGGAHADLCVVGGGLTGLSTALHAARGGLRVVLLERGALADGASGRNGGQAHIGMRRDQHWLETHLGASRARALWDIAQDARAGLLKLIADEGIACDWRPGLLHLDHRPSHAVDSRRTVAFMHDRYDDRAIRFVDRDEARALVASDQYHGGILDDSGGQLHPLDLTLGIARAAQRAGAALHVDTPALRIDRHHGRFAVVTPTGTVHADKVLLAGNGLIGGLDATLDAHVAPLDNYVAVTEPLGARAADLIRAPLAVSDSRFVVYYFRRTPDDRLLFGGGETYSRGGAADAAAMVLPHLLRVFPQLESVRLDYAWRGTLAVTANRMPYIRTLQPGLHAIGGYCGMGVVLAPWFGRLMADTLVGPSAEFDRLANIPVPAFPGGRHLRRPLLVAALAFLALRDRL